MSPFISFITPVYNNERYLPIAVESVLSQGLDDFEYIIVDDASTDETGRIAEELAQKDARIRVIHHSENQWIYAAMNTGVQAAQGEYIYILNSDDALEPGCFTRVAELAKQYRPDVVWTRVTVLNCDDNQTVLRSTSRRTGSEMSLPGDYVFYPDASSVRANWVHFLAQSLAWGQSNLYRTSLAKQVGFRNKTYGDDVFFNLGLAPSIKCAVLYKLPVYRFYVFDKTKRNASVSKVYGYEHQMFDDIYNEHKKLFMQWGVLNELALLELSKLRWHQFKRELRQPLVPEDASLDDSLFQLLNKLPLGVVLDCARYLACEAELHFYILSKCFRIIKKHPGEKPEKMAFVSHLLKHLVKHDITRPSEELYEAVNHVLNPYKIGACFLAQPPLEFKFAEPYQKKAFPDKAKQPLVSMVVPCYNKEPYLDRFFKSVYSQRWSNLELILVDDGSTDGSVWCVGEWVLKFLARGFQVRFLLQENRGVAVAVKNGMLRMSGELFCTVDPDDELHPEYISSMACFLTENDNYQLAFCRIENVFANSDGTTKRIIPNSRPAHGPDALRNVLCKRMLISIISAMVRTKYLAQCRVLEVYCTEPSVCQEPQILFPLLCGGGKVKVLEKVLYSAHMTPNSLSRSSTIKIAEQYAGSFLKIIRNTISTLDLTENQKAEALNLTDWFGIQYRYQKLHINLGDDNSRTTGFVDSVVKFINRHIQPCPDITADEIRPLDWRTLCKTVNRCIFNENIPSRSSNKRLIAYGALDRVAERLLPELDGFDIQPDVLWDQGADAASMVQGRPVTKPQFDTLGENDIVLIFPKAISKEEFYRMAKTAKPTVLHNSEIKTHLGIAQNNESLLKIINGEYVP